jgi:hypothetical protein
MAAPNPAVIAGVPAAADLRAGLIDADPARNNWRAGDVDVSAEIADARRRAVAATWTPAATEVAQRRGNVTKETLAGGFRVAVVIYSNVTTEAASRSYRALGFVAELIAAGDDVALVFDGGGSATLAAIRDPGHDLHRVWRKAAPALRGVCAYCARAYDVESVLKDAGVPMLADDRGHASLRKLLAEGRQIVTF